MEKVDDFRQGFFGLVLTCHVPEGHAGGFFHIHLGVGLPHAADASHTAHAFFRHPAHGKGQHQHNDQEGQEIHKEQQNWADRRPVVLVCRHVMLHQIGHGCIIGLELHGKQFQNGALFLALLVLVGVSVETSVRFRALHDGAGIDRSLFVGVGLAFFQVNQQDCLVRVEVHPRHLVPFHHGLKLIVLQFHSRGVVSRAGHVVCGVAHKNSQQHGPANQMDKTAPVAPVLASARFVVFIILVHAS